MVYIYRCNSYISIKHYSRNIIITKFERFVLLAEDNNRLKNRLVLEFFSEDFKNKNEI